jgi:hypothetical protein
VIPIIARVFPRRTKATPQDDYAFIGLPGLFVPEDITEVHISIAFTWDLPEVERLASAWERIAPVKVGGPAFNQPGGEFVPGRYLRDGYVITSRGCPNHCWFCAVWRRENGLKELVIHDGWNVLDDNILACSESHIRAVFAMLKRQPRKAEFTGGLEAKLLKPWHVNLIRDIKPHQLFFAYDTPDDWEPLVNAARIMKEGGCLNRTLCRVYVLIGYPSDTIDDAERRLQQVVDLGMFPMAMLYRDGKGRTTLEWRKFQRLWARPALIAARQKEATK